MGLVLARSGQLGQTYWQWTAAEWIDLIGTTSQEFLRPWPGWLDSGVRPYVLTYAYLLGGFAELHEVGRFHRPALAWRAFGREAVDDAVCQVTKVLAGWGYHGTEAQWAPSSVSCCC
ncbi:hypothetical protein AB0B56_31750 [Streptosporangium canum]|uniref:hypothetical protein n=1 Tax=Streptosporangium canum TaxID=324952 RepID=UPI0034441BF1